MSRNRTVDVWIDTKSVILSDNLGRKWLATYLQSNKMRISRIEIDHSGQDYGHPTITESQIIDVELFDFGISTHTGLERAAKKYISSLRHLNA